MVVNGWTLYAHPAFLDQVDALMTHVDALRIKHPTTYQTKNATKFLAAIRKLMFVDIPQDPTRSDYRQGDTLGKQHKHWFRAKFHQQYRLFFRYDIDAKVLIYAWVNDEGTKRAYGSPDDAYRVFAKMLDKGRPPTDWTALCKEAKAAVARLDLLPE